MSFDGRPRRAEERHLPGSACACRTMSARSGGRPRSPVRLDMRDPVEAAAAHRTTAAEAAAQFPGSRQGERTLTHKQRIAMAARSTARWSPPSRTTPASPRTGKRASGSTSESLIDMSGRVGHGRFGPIVNEVLDRNAFSFRQGVRGASYCLRRRGIQANEQLLKNAKGDYSPDPKADRFPEFVSSEKEKAAAQSLVSSLRPLRRAAWTLAGHDQALAAEVHSVRGVHRAEGMAPGDKAGRRRLDGRIAEPEEVPRLGEGQAGHRPATSTSPRAGALRVPRRSATGARTRSPGVRVRMPKFEERTRDKDLTEDEAKIILRAALEPPNKRMAPEYQAAFKWVPWIFAYTGARVNEITQMRAQDVKQVDGVWVFNITPEAGRNKTKHGAAVPIHPTSLRWGFWTSHEAQGRRLFYSAARTRGGKDFQGAVQEGRLSASPAWVREHGVDDEAVMPNHGWRHRLTSVLVGMRVEERVIDSILGQRAPPTARYDTK